MSIITVGSTAALTTALGQARAGDTIQLQPGSYSGLAIKNLNFAQDVTITSADPSHQAVLNNFDITNVTGLTISKVELVATGPLDRYEFNVRNSADVHFDHVNVHGSLDGNPANDPNGILFQSSKDVSITNSVFQQLGKAAIASGVSNVQLSGNTVHDIRSDGFDLVQVDHVTISGNNFTNFFPLATDHADAIQFWTQGATAASHDITISNNVVTKGSGSGSQGVFLKDEVGTLPYQNVQITGNLIQGGQYNGITVNHANGLTVSNNILTTAANGLHVNLAISNSDSVSATNNQAVGIFFTSNTHVTESGDTLNSVQSDNGAAVLANWLQAHGESGLYSSLQTTAAQTPADTTVAAATPPAATLGAATTTVTAPAVTATPTMTGNVQTMSPTATVLTLTGNNATGIGNSLDDSITGTNSADHIYGGDGNDTIDGAGGADILYGGAGNDVYIVSNSQTTIVEEANGGNDIVIAKANVVLSANVENLVISGTTGWSGAGNELNNQITGNSGANLLDGGAGNDTINAGAGNDTLIGGEGDDRLTGGSGVDVFRFGLHSGHDVITDFGAGGEKDVIDISAYKSAGLTASLHDVGADVVISFTTGDSITLLGVHSNQLIATTTGWFF